MAILKGAVRVGELQSGQFQPKYHMMAIQRYIIYLRFVWHANVRFKAAKLIGYRAVELRRVKNLLD